MSTKFAFAILIALTAPCGFSGTVLTTNLPAGDTIVNISGTADGAAAYGGANQDLWYQPFNLSGQLLEVTLQPGTYAFQLIDATDAASMFPALTGAQLAEIGGGGWTFNSPWTTDYMVFDSSAASNSTESQLFSGAINPSGATFSNAAAAYSAAMIGGYYNQVVVGGGRYTGTSANQFTISGSPETLIFVVPDYFLPDNGGIDSVLISPVNGSVPEPGTAWLLAFGVAVVTAIRRRCRNVALLRQNSVDELHRHRSLIAPRRTRKVSPCSNGGLPSLALSAGLLTLPIALAPSAAASSAFTGVNLAPGNGSPVVFTVGSAFASLSTSSPCGAAQGFGNAANDTVGVSASTVAGCAVPYNLAAYADAQSADGWLTSCTGCGVIFPTDSVLWTLSLNGTFGGAAGNQGILSFQDTISVNFAPAYEIFVGVTFTVGGPYNTNGYIIDEGVVDGKNPTTTPITVTVTGNTLSVNVPSTILLPTGGFNTHMEATASTNGSIDFYDPIQQTFVSLNPAIQFVSNGGDSTGSAVPEPGSFILSAAAFAGLGALRRRRRKQA